MAHGGQAHILCEQNQLEEALDHVQKGADQLDQVGGAWAAHVLNRVLARVQQAQGHWLAALDTVDRDYQIGHSAKVTLVATQAAALRAILQLAQGDLKAAETWAAHSGLGLNDEKADHPGWREVEYLSLARVLAAGGRHSEASLLLDRLLQSAQAERRDGSAIAILALQALVNQAQGNATPALACLERALTLAQPEGYVRLFVDEGDPMRRLLTAYQSVLHERLTGRVGNASRQLLAYTDKLLGAFSQPSFAAALENTVIERLSERELEILRLISQGHSNKEIADSLVIAVSTVKSHINSLYGKLGTHRRTQAVAIARDLGILSN